jgi:hypothetical protein
MRSDGARAHLARALAGACAVGALVAGCHVESGELFARRSTGGGAAGAAGAAGEGGLAGGDAGVVPRDAFLSPDGDDNNPGTEALPWLTFRHALPLLVPGSSLTLKDGIYDGASTGYLQVSCGSNAVNGTPDRPITIRAQNERQAFLRGNGTGTPIELAACTNWVLDGLRAEGVDVQGETGDEAGSVVVITHACSNVLLHRLVAAHPNRYFQSSVYVIAHAAPNVVVEESEALDFHSYGFHAYDSMQPVFRRDYVHSRDTPDLPGGYISASVTNGDGGFLLTKSKGAIVENCIAEHVADGFTIQGSRGPAGGQVQPEHDQLVGDVANDVTRAGFLLMSHCANTKPCDQGDQIVSTSLLSNDVARGGPVGVLVEGGVNLTIQSTSIFDTTDTGVSLALAAENMGLASSAAARSTLVTAPGAPFGFHSTGQVNWSFSRCNAYGPATTFAPRDGHVMNGTEVDPQLGACLVSVPATSPLAVPVSGSPAMGATLAFRYDGGVLTATKLWDQTTGAFPCGATVAGESDDPAVSCVGVAARLHVGGDSGCAIP